MTPLQPEGRGTVVCVLGMSRSGTSLTMRVLNLLGVYLGPEEGLLQPMQANPAGFWEHYRIMRLNTAILEKLGGSWREPPPLPAGWESSEELAEERAQARALLEETFAERELWGWKDPRNALTLPFWQQLVPDMRYVICLRNPLDVAASLYVRDGIEAAESHALWRIYVASAFANTSGRPRTLVSYERYFDDWAAVAARLARFLDIEMPADDDRASAIADSISSALHHHRSTPAEVLTDPGLPRDVCSLHLATQLLAEQIEGSTDAASIPANGVAAATDRYARRLIGAAPS